jgi:glycosyltransferase involved in cell wall biosynthesis
VAEKSISVVIPVRNRATVIVRALESVFSQTLRPAEIIVVDDGSNDGGATIKAALTFAHMGIPLRVEQFEQCGGAPRARNRGVAIAVGAWIALLDSDDAWAPTKLEEQIKLIDNDVCAVFTRFKMSGKDFIVYNKNNEYIKNIKKDLIYTNCLGGCSTALIRRSALLEVGCFDEAMPSCQDWDLWLKLREKGDFQICEKPLTLYFTDGPERISKNVNSIISGHKIIYQKILECL